MVELDWEGLRARWAALMENPDDVVDGTRDVEFEVRPMAEGVRAQRILAQVRDAIGDANAEAVDRMPDDPTWATDGDAVGTAVEAAITDGLFTEEEIRAWYDSLVARLEASGLDVRVGRPQSRRTPPSLDPAWWRHRHPLGAVAWLRFTARCGCRRGRRSTR